MERRVDERGIREPKMEWMARMQRSMERMKRMNMVRLLTRCSGGASGSSSSDGLVGFDGGEEGETIVYAPFDGLWLRKREDRLCSLMCWRSWEA